MPVSCRLKATASPTPWAGLTHTPKRTCMPVSCRLKATASPTPWAGLAHTPYPLQSNACGQDVPSSTSFVFSKLLAEGGSGMHSLRMMASNEVRMRRAGLLFVRPSSTM